MINRLNYTAPVSCAINITGRCNLSCKHCSASAEQHSATELTDDEIHSLVETLISRAHILSVTITGGEPLMRKTLLEVIEAFGKESIPVTLLTNATLVTRDIAARLGRSGYVRKIGTSLDGADARTHDGLRGAGAFEATCRGIRFLKETGVSLQAGCVVSRLNMHQLPQIARLAEDLDLNISFNRAAFAGRATAHRDLFDLSDEERDQVFDTVKELRRTSEYVTGGTTLEWIKAKATVCQERGSCGPARRSVCLCDICKESITICPDGTVVPCNNFWSYPVGNIRENDLLDIYRSERAQRVRELMLLRTDELDGCQGCPYAGACTGGCRAAAFNATGSLTGADPSICVKRYLQMHARGGSYEVA